jgi:hypothetical protein
MSHTLPPTQCASNTTTWTDTTLTAETIYIRKVHIDELRTNIANELSRRGLSAAPAYTDPTITAGSTNVKKTHLTELRTQIEAIHSGRSESGYCPGDTVSIPSWSTLTAGTRLKNTDITQMRTTLDSLKASCICETEQCQYCADCGYYYTYCSHNGVACNNSQSAEGCGHQVAVWACGSIDLAISTEHPYKSWDGGTSTAWDETVPWTQGDADRPEAAWPSWTLYEPPHNGKSHSDWGCKCNPYTWGT